MTARKKPKNVMRVRTSVWIENEAGQSVFGKGRLQILTAIRETGSIKAAAQSIGMSYRGLWGRLKSSEERLGFPLVTSRAGSGPSSGTRLTPEAVVLMERYEHLLTVAQGSAEQVFEAEIRALLNKRKKS